MSYAKNPYRIGAFCAAICGLLYLSITAVGGTFALLAVGALFLAMSYGLLLGWRWLAYVAFGALIIAGIQAPTGMWSPAMVSGWLHTALLAVSWIGVLALFVALWSRQNHV